MPTYTESEIPTVISTGNGGGYGNGMWGGDGAIWAILLLALLGGRGFGGFGGYGGGSSEFVGYELGKVATQADVSAGFASNATLSSLNDLKLGQAGIQQTLCQGFNGVNTSILTSANATQREISDCCCNTSRLIERSTSDIVQAGNANTQRIIDFLTGEKISSLQAENSLLTAQLSQNSQTATLLNAINRTPVPAYQVPNPYLGCGYGYNNGCNSCGL